MLSEELLGRFTDLAEVKRHLGISEERESPREDSRILFIKGEAGIGKSAFLKEIESLFAQRGERIVRTVGVQAEAKLPFSGLHQLIHPFLDSLAALPKGEGDAVRSAFGMGRANRPEPALINRGAGLILERSAVQQPLVLIVDDVQWLDLQTRDFLIFLSRRAHARITMIIAQRTGSHEMPGMQGYPRILLHPLSNPDAKTLVQRHSPNLSNEEVNRILAQAAGNPLALCELAVGQVPGATTTALTEQLERAFGVRSANLPAATRDLLLVAAADSSSDIDEIFRAVSIFSQYNVDPRDVTPAVDAQLLVVEGGNLTFRHPLVRSGVLESESVSRQLEAHRALARAVADPYRHAWHRARAATGRDDEAADLLVKAADQALQQGAVMAAAAALELAAELATSSGDCGRHLLRAAELAFDMGQEGTVYRLVAEALTHEVNTLDRARGQWLREIFSDGHPGDAPRVLELCDTSAQAAEAGDPDLALNLLLGAALRCWWAETGTTARNAVTNAADLLAEACDELRDDARWIAILAVAEPIQRGSSVHVILDAVDIDSESDPGTLRLLGMAAHAIGHEVRAAMFLSKAESVLRSQGRLGLLVHVLGMQASVYGVLGHWDRAEAAASEGLRLAKESGQPVWTAGTKVCHTQIRGLRGYVREASLAVTQTELPARSRRLNCLLSCVGLAKAIFWAEEGKTEQAFKAYQSLFDPNNQSYHERQSMDAIALYAEAAAQAGHLAEGQALLQVLEKTAQTTTSPLLHVQLAYARAVLADETEADHAYEQARTIDLHEWPWLDARLRLAHGKWLHKQGRRAAALVVLKDAHNRLETMRATAWIGQAERELRALV
ncbi:AAA family ATPase (plasmid) [Streptomyces sp. AHU1]|uniref:AAA family ATPase n=1 Tax=Streptomyces sp. AHU1 TaxID=3377215 RepID=UPI003877F54F